MRESQANIKVVVDKYTRVILTAIAVLLTVVVIGLWADTARLAGSVQGQERYVPRSTLELQAMTEQQSLTNRKLDELLKLLESGKVKVTVVGQADSPGASAGASTGAQEAKNDIIIIPSAD